MNLYREKLPTIEAYQYTGSITDESGQLIVPIWMSGLFELDKLSYAVDEETDEKVLIFGGKKTEVVVEDGDYFVKNISTGNIYVMNKEHFDSRYELVQQTYVTIEGHGVLS